MQEMNRRSSRTIIFIFFSATDNVIDTLNEAVQYANDVIVRILFVKVYDKSLIFELPLFCSPNIECYPIPSCLKMSNHAIKESLSAL